MRALVALVLLVALGARAQTSPLRYAEVVVAGGRDLPVRMAEAGVHVDHASWGFSAAGKGLKMVLTADEVDVLRQRGFVVDVQVADVEASFRRASARRQACPATPFPITGSMGCYPTFDETVAILDDMRARYPALVSERISIGTSVEGRPLWMVEIGDQPGVDEGEPEVLLNALHHAREPQGLSSLLHALWTGLEAYGRDPEWTHLLSTRRVFVVPVINPDGYVYNQLTNPEGGGMWRKNRRPLTSGDVGVDLNRNYGWEWGRDNSGSSPTPSGQTYRGPAAFSEPETQALRALVASRQFGIALNTHTYTNLLIYPWGYLPDLYTPDSAAFADMGRRMTRANGYRAGTSNQTVGYLVNGSSDDWMYGAEGVFAFTPEIGAADDGFWPAPERLLPLAEENVDMYRQAVRLSGPAVEATLVAVIDDPAVPTANGFPDPGETALVTFDVRNVGLHRWAGTIQGLVSTRPEWTLAGPEPVAVSLDPRASVRVTARVGIHPNTPLGARDGLAVSAVTEGYTESLLLPPLRVGTPTTVFASDASNLEGWTATGGWGLTSRPVQSPPTAFTDSPTGTYAPRTDRSLTRSMPVDLSAATAPALEFSARWSIEPDWDAGLVEASEDGVTWAPLAGTSTTQGVRGAQPVGQPVYSGEQARWSRERVSLQDYAGRPAVFLRFRLVSDESVELDGWVIDDIQITDLRNGGAVAGEAGTRAATLHLEAPVPNPSAGRVRAVATLPTGGHVTVQVVDVLGRVVRTVWDGARAAGAFVVDWDGLDAAGRRAAPGTYAIRLATEDGTRTRLVVLRR